MKVGLKAEQKLFPREIGKIHGKKKRPFLRPWMILVALIIVILYFENSGTLGSVMTIQKHKQVKTYFEGVYHQHNLTNQMLVDLMSHNKHDLSQVSNADIQNLHYKLNNTDKVFEDARVPKHFESYHDALVESLSIMRQITEIIGYRKQKNTYDYEKLNLLINTHNMHKASAKLLLEESFGRAKMVFNELDDGGFQYLFYTDERDEKR